MDDENTDRQKILLQILTKCVNRADVLQLGVVVDRILQQAHEQKSRRVGDILRFCIDAIAGNIYLHEENKNSRNCDSHIYIISDSDGSILNLRSSEALRSFILQGLHGSAPQDIRDLSLEFTFCLFKISDCKWSLENTEEIQTMEGLTIGQFAGLLCSILRGEIHLLLGEVVYLGSYGVDQKANQGDDGDVGKFVLTAEQKQARMDRIGKHYDTFHT